MAEAEYSIELKINDQPVPLNAFVQNLYINTLLGSCKALKDIPSSIDSLTIQIHPKK